MGDLPEIARTHIWNVNNSCIYIRESDHAKTPLHIFLLPLLAQADISTVIRILPYDNAAISVKQITAFRSVVHGHGNSYALEEPYGKRSLPINRVLSAGVRKFSGIRCEAVRLKRHLPVVNIMLEGDMGDNGKPADHRTAKV
jgi:hypothetical protein